MRQAAVRYVLLAATLLLVGLAFLASPASDALFSLWATPQAPLVVGDDRRCGPVPEDPWMASLADSLAAWIEAARTVPPDPHRTPVLREASLALTAARAEATLAAFFELRARERLAPPPSAFSVRDVQVRFCPEFPPVWQLAWMEGSPSGPLEPWRAVVRVEELPLEAEVHLTHPQGFLITDFDWGRQPQDPGAGRPAPPPQ